MNLVYEVNKNYQYVFINNFASRVPECPIHSYELLTSDDEAKQVISQEDCSTPNTEIGCMTLIINTNNMVGEYNATIKVTAYDSLTY